MNRTTGHIVSLLLRSDAFEAELNARILAAFRNGPAASTMASPRVLPGPPNRSYFIDRMLAGLRQLPFAVEIVSSDREVEQQLDRYADGLPDPANPQGTWHAMALDLRMDSGRGQRGSRLCARELPSEELVQVSLVFEPDIIDAESDPGSTVSRQDGERHVLAELLLALKDAVPVLMGTLGRDILVVDAVVADGNMLLEAPMSLAQLAGILHRVESEHRFEFAIVGAALAGAHRAFVYERHPHPAGTRSREVAGGQYDLRRIEELRGHVVRAEAACDAMYESKRPKDDKDDALAHLAKAIGVAGALGLEHVAQELQLRYEHIVAVYNGQFRR